MLCAPFVTFELGWKSQSDLCAFADVLEVQAPLPRLKSDPQLELSRQKVGL